MVQQKRRFAGGTHRKICQFSTPTTKLLNDGELRPQLGERAWEAVRDRFSPRQKCAVVARRYASLIGIT